MASYITTHNPLLDEGFISGTCEIRKRPVDPDDDENERFAVPDIISHEPGVRMEFYELKANSAAGKDAGRVKIAAFEAMVDFLRHTDPGIKYERGTLFDPDRSILIWDGTWLGSPVKAHLHFFREEEGLLVYEICVTVSGQLLAEVFIKAIIKLAVLAMILLLAPVTAGGVAVLAWNSPLSDSVGPDGVNDTQDVRYLQALLNDWADHAGQATVDIDGVLAGPTTDALAAFQSASGLDDTGGNLSPGDITVTSLERTHMESAAASVNLSEMQEIGMEGMVGVVFVDDPDGLDPEADVESDLLVALNNEAQRYWQDLHDNV
ncbi:peptidoglycan-binding domain-containing protein [Dactylosporangium maewongense]|uniref:peptidoglycan-binding domain-containing protein n=1 Tax=Dactylosporangium maewongense TaxID=634393 RepID=UPI0031D0E6ED